jgi:hypothetical protein
MDLSPQSAPNPIEVETGPRADPGHAADLAYQMVTIAAMLWLLGSLWVF